MASRAVGKQAAAKAATGLALGAGAALVSAAGLVALGAGGPGPGARAVSYETILAESTAKAAQQRKILQGEPSGEFEIYLDATAARLAMGTAIPLDPPQTEPDAPTKTAEELEAEREAARIAAIEAAAESQRRAIEERPSILRYLGRIEVGKTPVGLFASDTLGQITIPQGAISTFTVGERPYAIEVKRVEPSFAEVVEATIPRTLQRAERRFSLASAGGAGEGAFGAGQRPVSVTNRDLPGRVSPQPEPAAEASNDRVTQADVSQAAMQRRANVQRKLQEMGYDIAEDLSYRAWTEAERYIRLLERSERSRPDPTNFEQGVNDPEYREALRGYTEGVRGLRNRIESLVENDRR